MDIKDLVGSFPVRSRMVSWGEFLELTTVHPSRLGELIDLGWIEPQRTGQEAYLFRVRDVYRLRKLMRLMEDLELGLVGGTIVVDLLERIEYLESKVAKLERLL
ncbi:MAG: chaperone modulator CbpM [Thermodesulfobacteriota bacterium]